MSVYLASAMDLGSASVPVKSRVPPANLTLNVSQASAILVLTLNVPQASAILVCVNDHHSANMILPHVHRVVRRPKLPSESVRMLIIVRT